MRSLLVVVLMAFVVVTFAGCAGIGVNGLPMGVLYSEVIGPSAITTKPEAKSEKVGYAMATSVLGWVATGDASIAAAMKNGNIKVVHHVDVKWRNMLGVFAEMTTIVHGD